MSAFLEDMQRFGITAISLFPTCLSHAERAALYGDLERVANLSIPHVHLRADCDEGEIAYLAERFGTQAFNIHPRASSHPFSRIPPRFASFFYVENVDIAPAEDDFAGIGGLCPDFSHLANAAAFSRAGYVDAMNGFFTEKHVGCCHISALRPGFPNHWSGEWDHHEFASLSDLGYLKNYRAFLPSTWASMELENTLPQQLEAKAWLEQLLA
jgi:hypothetical protein